jgi:outer membrane lipoprotein SlyB
MKLQSLASVAAVSFLSMAGCTTPGYNETAPEPVIPTSTTASVVEYGTVRNIALVDVSTAPTGAGAVLGGVVGAVAGNQIGSGTGRVAATGAGAVGGALIGNQIERRRSDVAQVYRVEVQTDRGDVRTYQYSDLNGVQVGDRVRIQAGQLHRY